MGTAAGRILRVGLVSLSLMLVALTTASPLNAGSGDSTQIIFSSTNSAGSGGPLTPFGFWIWCFGAGSVPYTGQCTGAMYFYGTEPPQPVNDSASPVLNDGSATVYVQATNGSFECSLTGPVGKRVTVSVHCTSGPRTGTDTMPDSNVVEAP